MPEYLDLELTDGAAVRLELAPVGTPPPVPTQRQDLPEGFGTSTPVASGGKALALAADALRVMLSPLGPLLEEIHHSVSSAEHPPQEMTVEFGIQIGQDLKLGIVGVNGQATMTVSANWQLGQSQA